MTDKIPHALSFWSRIYLLGATANRSISLMVLELAVVMYTEVALLQGTLKAISAMIENTKIMRKGYTPLKCLVKDGL